MKRLTSASIAMRRRRHLRVGYMIFGWLIASAASLLVIAAPLALVRLAVRHYAGAGA